jgi:hypothetical protein
MSAIDSAEWDVKLLTAQFERTAAARELAEHQINASPADVESWLAATPRQKRRLMELWATFNSSYTK